MRATKRDLEKAGMEQVQPGVWTRGDPDTLKQRIAETDLFVSDFDECLHPSITQADVGIRIFRRIARSLLAPGHLSLFANMGRNAAPIIFIKVYQELTGDIQNSRMIKSYEKLARGLPLKYFEEEVELLSERFFTGVPGTLRLLSERGIPTGVVSLGLDIILGGLLSGLEKKEGVKVDFLDCTRVEADAGGGFMRYDPEKAYMKNEDKRHLLRSRVNQYESRCLMVVGHDRDDLMMLDEAKRLGGLTLGFRPARETLPLLDAAVLSDDWRPIYALLSEAFRESESDGS